jgi:predicted transcriptional regulator
MVGSFMAKPEPAPSPHADDRAFAKAVDDGLKSLNDGRSLPYENVRRWLLSWGTDKELPPPKCR